MQVRIVDTHLQGTDVLMDSARAPLMVSRRHAELSQCAVSDDHGRFLWKVTDFKSLNGVFVNDVKVKESVLGEGDTVTFGGGAAYAYGTHVKKVDCDLCYVFRWAAPAADPGQPKKEAASSSLSPPPIPPPQSPLEVVVKTVQDPVLVEQLHEKDRLVEEQRKKVESLESELRRSLVDKEELEKKQKEQEMTFQERMERAMATADEDRKQVALSAEQELQRAKSAAQTQQDELAQLRTQVKRAYVPMSDLADEFTCAICQEFLSDPHTLECSHSFCLGCIRRWGEHQPICPVCRRRITKPAVKSLALANAIAKLKQREIDALKEAKVQGKAAEEAATAAAVVGGVAAPALPPNVQALANNLREMASGMLRNAIAASAVPSNVQAPAGYPEEGRNSMLDSLRNMIELARKKNLRFLKVTDKWSEGV
eukprot:TRINITY_DN15354_c0_g3_i1.p1 TRINITY_DN15354_c0_g3~~TRINITY_DN15354_c0_g3_i1.p1  ORF type:complete len:425 (-),score=123.66 TRINITY_DN15354_c0_g3_i1:1255-2529(-)